MMHARIERLASLKLEADAVLEQYAEMTTKGINTFTLQGRHQAYKTLRLRVSAQPDEGMEASSVFYRTSSIVYDQGIMNVNT